MSLQLTGLVEFEHVVTGRRLISREALRDLPGHVGYRQGLTEDATELELLECVGHQAALEIG